MKWQQYPTADKEAIVLWNENEFRQLQEQTVEEK